MKCLKIDRGKGLFLDSQNGYSEIDRITKEDILRLLDIVTERNEEFEMDNPEVDAVLNEAHRIIYVEMYKRFKELIANKDSFFDECERVYKEAIEKYQDEDEVQLKGE